MEINPIYKSVLPFLEQLRDITKIVRFDSRQVANTETYILYDASNWVVGRIQFVFGSNFNVIINTEPNAMPKITKDDTCVVRIDKVQFTISVIPTKTDIDEVIKFLQQYIPDKFGEIRSKLLFMQQKGMI